MQKLNRLLITAGLTFIILLTVSPFINADFIEIIKNPEPNMVEPKYSELNKVKTLNGDLGNGEYLFKPFSITTNGTHIFVYDILQAKIFKLDKDLNMIKSFGRKGRGPGEFSGTGKGYPVFIHNGRDGLLYAYDLSVRRLTVLDENLKYLREYVNVPHLNGPAIVDNKGNQYYNTVDKNKVIDIMDQHKSKSMTLAKNKESFSFLLKKPRLNIPPATVPTILPGLVLMDITPNLELLLYVSSSSSLIVIKNGKVLCNKYLWPKEALKFYKTDLKHIIKADHNMFRTIFFKMFTDEDTPGVFYLHYGLNFEKDINTLYQFNTKGNLLNVFYVKTVDSEFFSQFKLKVGGKFYAVEDTNLTIYKINEVKQ